ncbi:MAG: hypothetical protein V4440_06215, partial [Pseudomonadota bacterium]
MKSRKMPRLALNVVAIAIASAYPLVSMAEDTTNKEKTLKHELQDILEGNGEITGGGPLQAANIYFKTNEGTD